jgi:hypothetical protein
VRSPELIFDDALTAFLEYEGSWLLSDVSERNTCGRLAIFIERQLKQERIFEYYTDTEYNRKQSDQVKTIINKELRVLPITADLIVHSRGDLPAPDDNLIAVEVKKSSRPAHEKNADKDRLIAMTSPPYNGVWNWEDGHPEHVCGYSVGIFMEIRRKEHEIFLEYFKLGQKTNERLIKIPARRVSNYVKEEFW